MDGACLVPDLVGSGPGPGPGSGALPCRRADLLMLPVEVGLLDLLPRLGLDLDLRTRQGRSPCGLLDGWSLSWGWGTSCPRLVDLLDQSWVG